MPIEIVTADLNDPQFIALVSRHADFCDGTAPPESCHRLTVDELSAPGLSVWMAHDKGTLLGMGALNRMSDTEGELKSMHTTEAARGKGVGRLMLRRLLDEARACGLTQVSLETGSHPDFAPARALYASEGFAECPPFGSYGPDPHSVFMTLWLDAAEAST